LPIPIPVLISAKVIVNITKSQEPLQFQIIGQRLLLGQLKVQIVELGEKTSAEIRQEYDLNREFRDKYQKYENPTSNTLSSQRLPRDDRGYIIWPLNGSTQLPFFVKAAVINSQSAIFSLNDYSWLNSRLKWYGIFATNDGINFAGIDGENESARLDVKIEEGEQFVNYVRFQLSAWQAWLIPPIVIRKEQRSGTYEIAYIVKRPQAEITMKHNQQADIEAL
ncbi:MAG: hypothetical protein EZS28_051878, partial [Streblomastix strix]